MTGMAWKKDVGLSRLSRGKLTKAKSLSQLELLSLLEGTAWRMLRGTAYWMLLAVAWQLYCYGKETPWQRLPFFGCSLFFLEQVLNFLFPGEGQDLKYLFKMF